MKPGYALLFGVLSLVGGCAGPFVRSQSPEADEPTGPAGRTIGDVAVPFGMYPVRVESIGLITGLPDTGSDPEPGPQRAAILDEMKARGVAYPNQVLASPTTSLVLVQALLRPGIQKGDHFDVEVRVPARSGTTSLRGGRLMETRLKELAIAGGSIREGSPLALAGGPLLVDPSADEKDNRVALGRARVLGGGVALRTRPMGLVLKPDHRNVMVSSQVGTAVNRRFHSFDAGVQHGVAKPKDNEFIELAVHPRYKDNVDRYIQVVRAIAIRENSAQQLARLALVERQLLDPITAASAAIKLEAIGREGIPALKKGLVADDPEVRFYSAEALAYLDQPEAAKPLADAARDEPAFRAYALAALSAMDDFAAYEALRGLLDLPSAETRYGAFRSLWAMNSKDASIRGENLGGEFNYHVLATTGSPMVHVTRSYRPEVTLFGHEQRFSTPVVLEAGQHIIVNARDADHVTVSRFTPNEQDQKRVVTSSIDDCIRAIVELGGTYPDVVQALQQARTKHALPGKLAVDAVPSGGRSYLRSLAGREGESHDESEVTTASDAGVVVANPIPGLFSNRVSEPSPVDTSIASVDDSKDPADGEKKPPANKSFFAKMKGLGRQ